MLDTYSYIIENVVHYNVNSFLHIDVRLVLSRIVNNIEGLVVYRFSVRQFVENLLLSYNTREAL